MATETEGTDATAGGFGRVSRTKGIAFKYGLLAATLVGILALGILLVYVSLDAIQPLTADPGWHLVFLLTFVLPATAVGVYLARRDDAAWRTGLAAVFLPLGGVLAGSGVAVLFIETFSPIDWLALVVVLALTAGVVVGHRRVREHAATERSALGLVTLAGTLWAVPSVVWSIPTLPADWLILALTLGGPAALLVARRVGRRYESTRAGRAAGTVAFGVTLLGGVLAPLVGLHPLPGVVLALATLVPAGLFAGVVLYERPERRVGLLLPVVVFGGALLGAWLASALGFAGPQSWVDWHFLTNDHSFQAEDAGIYPAIVGSILLMIVVTVLSFPLGVGAAVYLEEYAPDNRLTRLIQINISNLAGVPSVVYGLLGLGIFIKTFQLPAGSVLVGGTTLSLLILPIVIISAQEAVRSVPDSLREASYGMGATKWQTIREVVLPRAFPGILTGTILAIGRAIGETAPLIIILLPTDTYIPTGFFSKGAAMPMQIYVWATQYASPAFYTTAVAAGVVTLLVVLLAINSVAIVLRNKYQNES